MRAVRIELTDLHRHDRADLDFGATARGPLAAAGGRRCGPAGGNLYCSYSLNGGQKWNGHTRLGPGFNPGLAAGFTPGSDPEREGLHATFLSKAGGYNGLMTQLMTVAEP